MPTTGTGSLAVPYPLYAFGDTIAFQVPSMSGQGFIGILGTGSIAVGTGEQFDHFQFDLTQFKAPNLSFSGTGIRGGLGQGATSFLPSFSGVAVVIPFQILGKYRPEHDSALAGELVAVGFQLEHDNVLQDVGSQTDFALDHTVALLMVAGATSLASEHDAALASVLDVTGLQQAHDAALAAVTDAHGFSQDQLDALTAVKDAGA